MEKIATARFRVYGIVQGVGFRPTVDRHASTSGIRGSVCNKGPYVEIFAQGTEDQIGQFETLLREQPPRRSSILKIDKKEIEGAAKYSSFAIVESEKTEGEIFISPDIAICEECAQELYDPSNRRYLHPFINCTCCGPRLTILDALPYDRERTSMKMFPMCRTCAEEYYSPLSRRYDAQPVCCNECGPEVYLLADGGETTRGREAITAARKVILAGGIVAVKGIGGFHLCCDATNEDAVHRLRVRKRRPAKPFAVMMKDERTVRRECVFNEEQRQILTGHQKPILLLDRSTENEKSDDPGLKNKLAPSVAPGNPKVGVMLPYAPLQMLLFEYDDGLEMPDCLIMTSGNVSGAPICRDDRDALDELSGFCDCILSHNRLIRIRADDTVMDFHRGHPYMIRRSRGYAPLPVLYAGENNGARANANANKGGADAGARAQVEDTFEAPVGEGAVAQGKTEGADAGAQGKAGDAFEALVEEGAVAQGKTEGAVIKKAGSGPKKNAGEDVVELKGCVLAVGGELKNTFCIVSGNLFYLSPYVGDLEDLRTVRALEETIGRMEKLLEVSPQAVVCDLHPKYNSTEIAEEIASKRGIPLLRIQHHYAHVLSCMAENDRRDPVIGVSFDGTGYGEDGTIWGGEIMIADAHGYERVRSIAPFLQIGGDSAPRQGWRIAASMIRELCDRGFSQDRDAAQQYFDIIETLSICDLQNAKAQRMMAERRIQAVTSTSAGRLFDAVSAMLGICRESTYEGEASIELEFAAERFVKKNNTGFWDFDKSFPGLKGDASGLDGNASGFDRNVSGLGGNASGFDGNIPAFGGNVSGLDGNASGFDGNIPLFDRNVSGPGGNASGADGDISKKGLSAEVFSGKQHHMRTDLLFEMLLRGRLEGEDPEKLAWLFHAGLAKLIVEACVSISGESGIKTAALTGGCFQNRLLLTMVQDGLTERGIEVLIHHLVPPNDGGIALGQALAAMCRRAEAPGDQ